MKQQTVEINKLANGQLMVCFPKKMTEAHVDFMLSLRDIQVRSYLSEGNFHVSILEERKYTCACCDKSTCISDQKMFPWKMKDKNTENYQEMAVCEKCESSLKQLRFVDLYSWNEAENLL